MGSLLDISNTPDNCKTLAGTIPPFPFLTQPWSCGDEEEGILNGSWSWSRGDEGELVFIASICYVVGALCHETEDVADWL
jgi:hypothetical protein